MSMTRLNVRIREALFQSLLRQSLAFYDATKVGERSSLCLRACLAWATCRRPSRLAKSCGHVILL